MGKKENTIYIDMITTNYNGQPDDADVNDVVKITIIDDNRKILLNTYVYPCYATSEAWEVALFYNNITRLEINRAPNLDVIIANVRDIITSADNIIMYNVNKIYNYFQKWNIAPITIMDVSAIPTTHNYIMPLLPLSTIAYRCGYFTSVDDYINCCNLHDTYQYAMMLQYIYHYVIDNRF
jgi:hypothetical protein